MDETLVRLTALCDVVFYRGNSHNKPCSLRDLRANQMIYQYKNLQEQKDIVYFQHHQRNAKKWVRTLVNNAIYCLGHEKSQLETEKRKGKFIRWTAVLQR